MIYKNNPGTMVTSRKLLMRLREKGLIEEPPESERPEQPSRRRWGGPRGYHYVRIPAGRPSQFDFEGSTYTTMEANLRTYIYRNATETSDDI